MNKFISKANNYGLNTQADDVVSGNEVTGDLSNINLEQLAVQLSKSINSKEPFTIWGKNRQNEKIALDIEKQRLILDKIKMLRDITKEFIYLKADAIFSQEFIQSLVADRRMIAEQHFERAIAEHRNHISSLEVSRALDEARITEANLKFESMRAEISRINAETNRINVASKKDEKIASLIDSFVSSSDWKNLPDIYKIFMASSIINADVSQLNGLELNDKLKEFIIQQAQAEAKLKDAAAESAAADVELKKMNNQITKKDAGL